MKPNALFLCCIAAVSGCANISGSYPVTLASGGIRFEQPLKTWKDILEQNIVMQQFDYSCGAAALATLLQYYFQDDVSEKDILEDIVNQLNEADFENRKKEGLSLLDLKQFANRRGYQAVGVKNLKFSALPKLRGPVLVYLETSEYRHFAILRGVKEDRIFLADPSRGNIRMSVEVFAQQWPKIALVLGKKGFGTPTEHSLAIQEKSPLLNGLAAARRAAYIGQSSGMRLR
ncbi:MAG: C39 family peptidase [Gammaproteobacteria bacterium]|nr:C39 family peptidase [Gammaproteobacteria bacterium]